ncbi:HMG-box, partial [Patellaria atrata CBS 101060]
MSELRERLEYLGLSQYFDAFVAEGFDSWETVLDITEPDLASLEVKLGHRRKLQRAIRESRSTSIDSSLPPTFSRGLSGDGSYRSDESGPETRQKRTDPFGAVASGSSTKRRYRRHPKPDEHAPERPASAYVIFSNQTREELKGQELSFADIAKVVGERWQVLPSDVREVFESQAAVAKEKYYLELAEYKKTSQYAQYQTYLQEFRAKHASNTSDKRSKLETETSISTQGS